MSEPTIKDHHEQDRLNLYHEIDRLRARVAELEAKLAKHEEREKLWRELVRHMDHLCFRNDPLTPEAAQLYFDLGLDLDGLGGEE